MKLCKYILLLITYPMLAFAQNLGFTSGGGDIEISANNGVVWDRIAQEVTINENATMTQGDLTLSSDVILINYIEGKTSSYEISLLRATDNVVITSAGDILTGDVAVFEPNKGIAILKGDNATLVSPNGKIKAKVFEYLTKENKAIARDDVVLTSDKGVVNAKTAVAYMSNSKKGTNGITKIELFENISIKTEGEVISGKTAVYNLVSGQILIKDDVIIQKGKNFLKGDIAEVNLNTGISKLRSTSGKQIGGKVVTQK